MKVVGVPLLFFVCFIVATVAKALNVKKCQSQIDDGCVGNILTYLIKHCNEHPELNMPKIHPYERTNSSTFRTLNSKSPINFIAENSNITIHGFETVKVTQVKGFQRDPNMKRFEFTLFAPDLTSFAEIKLSAHFFSIHLPAIGFTETQCKNLVAHQIVDCDVIERHGKQYVNVKNIHTHVNNVGHYSMKFESPEAMPFSVATVSRIINANWKILYVETKPQLESIIGEIVEAFLTPIFDTIPIQDFFQ